MSMLARYKKGGGILELVKMIEDSVEPKRSQLMNMIRAEDPEFAARVEGRLFSYDMFKTLPENLIAEIVSSTPAKIIALSLITEADPAFVALCERCLGKSFAEYKSEKETVASQPPTPAQVDAARKKMISEARKLEAEGKIKLPFTEAAENAAAANAPKLGSPVSGSGAGTATEDSGCPPLASFGIEPPPPGMTGERLEQYLKSQLES